MLDAVRAVTLAIAAVTGARQRFFFGVACAVAVGYGLLASTFAVAGGVARSDVGGEYAFALLFLGPSAVPVHGTSAFPASGWIATHAIAVLSASAVLGAAPCAWAWRRAHVLSPHSIDSRRWDVVTSSFLLLTVIATIRLMLAALVDWFGAR